MDNNTGYENYASQMNNNFSNLKALALGKKRQDDLEQFQAVEEKYESLDAVGQKYMEASGFITGLTVAGKGGFKKIKELINKGKAKKEEDGEDEDGDLEDANEEPVEPTEATGDAVEGAEGIGEDVGQAGEQAVSTGRNFVSNMVGGSEEVGGDIEMTTMGDDEGFSIVSEATSDLPTSYPSSFGASAQTADGAGGEIEMAEMGGKTLYTPNGDPYTMEQVSGGGDSKYEPDSGGEYEDEADDVYESGARELPLEGEGQSGFGTPYESKEPEEDEDDGFETVEEISAEEPEPEAETGETGVETGAETGAEMGETGIEAGVEAGAEIGGEVAVEAGLGIADALTAAIPIVGEVVMVGSALAVAGMGIYKMIQGGEERTEEAQKQQDLLKQAPTAIDPTGRYVVATADATNETSSHFSGF